MEYFLKGIGQKKRPGCCMSRNWCVCVHIYLQLRGEVSSWGFEGGFSSTSSLQLQFGGPTRFFGLGLVPNSAHGAEFQDL